MPKISFIIEKSNRTGGKSFFEILFINFLLLMTLFIPFFRLNDYNKEARSELMWASAMAENGILKIGNVTDFQAHQIEHQLGAYTDCNHGQGLAVIHPVLYRHIYKDNIKQFACIAEKVWEIPAEGKTQEGLAEAGIRALEEFIHETGLPQTFTEMGITDKGVLKKVADTCNITEGCCKKL